MAKLRSISRWTSRVPAPSLLQTLMAVGIIGILAVIAIPAFFQIGETSDLKELQTLYVAYHNTEIGRAARRVIDLGSLTRAKDGKLQALLNKRELETLLVATQGAGGARDSEAAKRLLQTGAGAGGGTPWSPAARSPLDPGGGASSGVAPQGSLAEAIQEAAELARVRKEHLGQFAAEVTRAWEPGSYEANIGALIGVLRTWQARADAGE
jgi:hypothetical protein